MDRKIKQISRTQIFIALPIDCQIPKTDEFSEGNKRNPIEQDLN